MNSGDSTVRSRNSAGSVQPKAERARGDGTKPEPFDGNPQEASSLRVPRRKLLRHLKRVQLGSQLPEVPFGADLSVTARSAAGSIYVIAPSPLETGAPWLEDAFGLGWMEGLINAVSRMRTGEKDQIQLRLDGPELLITGGGSTHDECALRISDYEAVGTSANPDAEAALRQMLDQGDRIHLPRSHIEEIPGLHAAFGRGKAQLKVSKEGQEGGYLRFGKKRFHRFERAIPDVTNPDGSCVAEVQSVTLAKVLSSVPEPQLDDVTLILTDDYGYVGIETDDGYLYALDGSEEDEDA